MQDTSNKINKSLVFARICEKNLCLFMFNTSESLHLSMSLSYTLCCSWLDTNLECLLIVFKEGPQKCGLVKQVGTNPGMAHRNVLDCHTLEHTVHINFPLYSVSIILPIFCVV